MFGLQIDVCCRAVTTIQVVDPTLDTLVDQLELLHHCNIIGMSAGWRIQHVRAGRAADPPTTAPAETATPPKRGGAWAAAREPKK